MLRSPAVIASYATLSLTLGGRGPRRGAPRYGRAGTIGGGATRNCGLSGWAVVAAGASVTIGDGWATDAGSRLNRIAPTAIAPIDHTT